MSTAEAVVKRRKVETLPDGRQVEIEMLGFKDYEIIAEQACARYKRSIVQTYTENMDLVPADLKADMLKTAFERAEKITKDTLPMQEAWMPKEDADGKYVINTGPRYYNEDSGQWTETGDPVLEKRKMDYTAWWMSFTLAGKAFTTWQSVRKCNGQERFTLDEIESLFLGKPEELEKLAQSIGELSRPRLGNEEPAAAEAGTATAGRAA